MVQANPTKPETEVFCLSGSIGLGACETDEIAQEGNAIMKI